MFAKGDPIYRKAVYELRHMRSGLASGRTEDTEETEETDSRGRRRGRGRGRRGGGRAEGPVAE